ncbi:uncharacterized protein ARB_04698 [Trichophyton benhamiae CBS 112371]|uniref:Uncharacterized protein n=1 Tax=Arthroderma benhamiae (strain ATCC MYA-4681 / CBS 112371) TaxID=663331 RepID=D4AK96_ARTBC|nr:uncharacterized protein ARB_04698 [Trichophyton benhamiae CBS 112371]EFE37169.1 hypothetical protein ARB_04698 [Trichophyton benhamiae CBS 112371]
MLLDLTTLMGDIKRRGQNETKQWGNKHHAGTGWDEALFVERWLLLMRLARERATEQGNKEQTVENKGQKTRLKRAEYAKKRYRFLRPSPSGRPSSQSHLMKSKNKKNH